MDSAPDFRCKRSAGLGKWRCSEPVVQGKSYCEKHYLQLQKNRQKSTGKGTYVEDAIGGGDGVSSRRLVVDVNMNKKMEEEKKMKKVGGESDKETGGEFRLARFLVREGKTQLSTYRRKRANRNSGKCVKVSAKTFGDRDVDSGEGPGTSGREHSDPGEAQCTVAEREPFEKESSRTKEQGSSMCHQCQRSNKSVVSCSNCNRKRYCFDCVAKWYPGKTREEVETACPFCFGNCNCKACLREVLVIKPGKELDRSVKLLRLQYLVCKALPALRHIHMEHNSELEIEANIQGVKLTERDITRSRVEARERIYW